MYNNGTTDRIRPEIKDGEKFIYLGYVYVKAEGRKQLEHRFVVEKSLGRKLYPGESVHHRNGDRTDNRLENLELWSTSHPSGQRISDKLTWAREILSLYSDLEGMCLLQSSA